MNRIKYTLGYFCSLIEKLSAFYKLRNLNKVLGGERNIHYPFIVAGAENIQMAENVNIGPGATIYTTVAKLIIKQHVISGPNLTIITGIINI